MLTNDFFVNLLDYDTTWTPVTEDAATFEGRGADGEVKWTGSRVDLVFGSNSELRAVAEVYAGDDGREHFVADFVAAWAQGGERGPVRPGLTALAFLDAQAGPQGLAWAFACPAASGHALVIHPERADGCAGQYSGSGAAADGMTSARPASFARRTASSAAAATARNSSAVRPVTLSPSAGLPSRMSSSS